MSENTVEESISPLLQILVDQEIATPEVAAQLQAQAKEEDKTPRAIILGQGLMTEDQLLEIVAGYMGTTIKNLPQLDIPTDVVRSLPANIARQYHVVPVAKSLNSLELATYDVIDPGLLDELMFLLSCDVTVVMAAESDVVTLINQFYGEEGDVGDMLSAMDPDLEDLGDSLEKAEGIDDDSVADSQPVKKFVNLVLYTAISERASDIHFEPFEKEFKIRYRVDGALYEMAPPPRKLGLPIISRIKVLSNLNIAERRLPQDGRVQLTVAGRQVDLRVSTLPTQFGESVVLRVLDRSVVSLELENLGMPDDIMQDFIEDLDMPNGIIIVTGPTGSGKTTTLYSGLKRINTIDRKLLTAEEPIEYDIEGIIQVPISEVAGNTFGNVLRAFLRQDPDIMMVGEIRDLETAQIAVQASLTGHLVFSTLHTNDSAGAVTRLVDMDVEPFLVSSTLTAVLGQRLIRTICPACKEAYQPDDEVLALLDMKREAVQDRPFYFGKGCSRCNNIGYKGRKGLYEYLKVNNVIRDMINNRQPTLRIKAKAVETGMRTMREDGVRNILDGYTTVEEVVKYT